MFIKPPVFNGDGEEYILWKDRLMACLAAAEVDDVLDIVPPNPSAAWIKRNKKCKAIIYASLSNDQLVAVRGMDRCSQIITRLDEIYGKIGASSEFYYRNALQDLKMENSDLTKHFANFDSILSKLKHAGGNVGVVEEVCYLLRSLPADYDMQKQIIQATPTENITLAAVKKQLNDFYDANLRSKVKVTNVNNEKSEPDNTKAFLVNSMRGRGRGRGNFRGNSGRTFNRNNSGRTFNRGNNYVNRDNNYGSRNNLSNRSNNTIQCYKCGKYGHIEKFCWSSHNYPNEPNQNQHRSNTNQQAAY